MIPIQASAQGTGGVVSDLISISVVSHGQAELVSRLLTDLNLHRPSGIEVILTLNLEKELPFRPSTFAFPIKVIRNRSPRGFASNHNAAFRQARGGYFCVLNPDIRLAMDPFPALLAELSKPTVAAAAPLILDPSGTIADSARPFPTPLSLLRKAIGMVPERYYDVGGDSISPDWIAGMFILLRRDAFASVGGFDTRYYLYYEDVDLCARLRLAGYDIRLVPGSRAEHLAQRQSHREFRYSFWHIRSMARYLLSGTRRRARKAGLR